MHKYQISAVCLVVVVSMISLPRQSASAEYGRGAAVPRSWMDRSLSPVQRADLLIKEMTLAEKIVMMHGVNPLPTKAYVGYVPPNPRLGIPALTLADGRAGVGNGARDITLLPAPIAAASSWDIGLANEFGRILGDEQLKKGTNVALAPSIDVVRVPEWGRIFESYGEDPYFNGQMAVAEINGIQRPGLIADANMYLTMNQENNRFKEDSIVDQRTLEEIYLPPFEAAIQNGHVGTVMCAYVKTNGTYSCENAELLNEILRKQLGFDGWVMSDWGATHSTVLAARSSLDQQMPDDRYYGVRLKEAVASGDVSEKVVDDHLRSILVPMFRQGLFEQKPSGTWATNARSAAHDAFSRRVAEEGTILLKNGGGVLPLAVNASIAVIGEAGGTAPKVEGGGSSAVIAPYKISPLEGIRKRAAAAAKVTYADGSDLNQAAKTAGAADAAVVFVHTDETEDRDRPNLELPGNQDQLISTVAAANKRTIVVLDTGGPVLMPWIGRITGLIEAWYPGQEDGNAIAAILYGDVDPSGRLPLTFPRSATDIATASEEQWPGVNGQSKYSEKLNVGYRWYDATNTEPLFPFGFGLSYTTFRVSGLAVARSDSSSSGSAGSGPASKGVSVKLKVANTGKRDGAEVVQVYVGQPSGNGEPPHQLRAFAKVQLKAGEVKTVSLVLDERSFSIYDSAGQRWISPDGTYEILVGTSSRDLPLREHIRIKNSSVVPQSSKP
jgi:beta-glucosidase